MTCAGQWVSIQVHGELQDGTVFEDSSASGKSLSFQLGSGQVILGMDGGVAGMRVGGTRVLNVPPHLGYGFKRVGDIPPNSVRREGAAPYLGELHCVLPTTRRTSPSP